MQEVAIRTASLDLAESKVQEPTAAVPRDLCTIARLSKMALFASRSFSFFLSTALRSHLTDICRSHTEWGSTTTLSSSRRPQRPGQRCISRQSRKQVVVLERRHVLGGAPSPKKSSPGSFSECSYVVSLLRPEIIRELDSPPPRPGNPPARRHVLSMSSGDYLWRVNDHAKSIRDIRRHSRLDAEAYDEFSKMMTPMCRFVKPCSPWFRPIPPAQSQRPQAASLPPSAFPRTLLRRALHPRPAHDYELRDFLDQCSKPTFSKPLCQPPASLVRSSAFVRPAAPTFSSPLHGEIDGAFRSWGFSRRHWRHFKRHRRRRARSRRRNPHQSARGKILTKNAAPAASLFRAAKNSPPTSFFQRRPASHVRKIPRTQRASCRFSRKASAATNFAALPAKLISPRCASQLQIAPRARAHLRGAISISPSMEYMERAYDDAKYGRYSRRPYIDMVIPSVTDPSVAPPQTRALLLRAVRPIQTRRKHWTIKRSFGDNVINTSPSMPPTSRHHYRPPDPHPARPRARIWPHAGQYFSGRAFPRTTLLPSSRRRLGLYRTPIRNLYMCGSATHPGGGIMGANAASPARSSLKDGKAVLRAQRRPRRRRPTDHALGQRVALIGGGHNALVTAFYLAKGGFKPSSSNVAKWLAGGHH